MASIPYLSRFVEAVVGPIFNFVGASPAMAATSIIAVDMGGYQLAQAIADNTANWIMAAIVGYMAGATIVFSIPVWARHARPPRSQVHGFGDHVRHPHCSFRCTSYHQHFGSHRHEPAG